MEWLIWLGITAGYFLGTEITDKTPWWIPATGGVVAMVYSIILAGN